MIILDNNFYCTLSDKIVDSLDLGGECNVNFSWETEEYNVEATVKLRCYRTPYGPDLNPITSVAFFWIEVQTITDDGEETNDFDCDELRKWILYARQ